MNLKLHVVEKIEKTYKSYLEEGGSIEVHEGISSNKDTINYPKGYSVVTLKSPCIASTTSGNIRTVLDFAKRQLLSSIDVDDNDITELLNRIQEFKERKDSKLKEVKEINRALKKITND